jgi:hypothetical protein
MVTYNESGVDLIQARGKSGRFLYQGHSLRLGTYSGPDGWYLGVHMSSGRLFAALSLENAKNLKEAADMLRYGFFLHSDVDPDLVEHLRKIGLLSVPSLELEA